MLGFKRVKKGIFNRRIFHTSGFPTKGTANISDILREYEKVSYWVFAMVIYKKIDSEA